MDTKKIAMQIVVYVVGLIILAFGVAFGVHSALGISPVNSLSYVVSQTSGISMGISVTGFFVFCILLQIVILRKEFRWINLSQIIFSSILGVFIDIALIATAGLYASNYFVQLAMLGASIILIAFGLTIYLSAKMVSLPPEGVVEAILQKTGKGTFSTIKVIMDSLIVLAAVVLALLLLGNIIGVREGTIASAILIGKAMPPIDKVTQYLLKKVRISF